MGVERVEGVKGIMWVKGDKADDVVDRYERGPKIS